MCLVFSFLICFVFSWLAKFSVNLRLQHLSNICNAQVTMEKLRDEEYLKFVFKASRGLVCQTNM